MAQRNPLFTVESQAWACQQTAEWTSGFFAQRIPNPLFQARGTIGHTLCLGVAGRTPNPLSQEARRQPVGEIRTRHGGSERTPNPLFQARRDNHHHHYHHHHHHQRSGEWQQQQQQQQDNVAVTIATENSTEATASASQGVEPDACAVAPLPEKPAPLNDEDMKADISCKVCHEQKVDTVTEPCGHLAMCRWCAHAWKKEWEERRQQPGQEQELFRCPMCRDPIKSTKRVHLVE